MTTYIVSGMPSFVIISYLKVLIAIILTYTYIIKIAEERESMNFFRFKDI